MEKHARELNHPSILAQDWSELLVQKGCAALLFAEELSDNLNLSGSINILPGGVSEVPNVCRVQIYVLDKIGNALFRRVSNSLPGNGALTLEADKCY